ncbi:hypothetical protein KRP22_006105 [Phytophthora ramorum]|uniref:RxLR effector protein n=1 Tax=Phytophthora ramorum TaxID=164328 RepID=H3H3R8_PHYRM|nr:RxLR effector protein [Phytophthora ramorum]
MRLSYVLLVAAAALVSTLDATSTASGTTLSQLNTANAVGPTESIGNGRRFLRKHEVVQDDEDGEETNDEEEERGIVDSAKALKVMAQLARAQTTDDMARIISSVREPGVMTALFTKAEGQLKNVFPTYHAGMGLDDFYTMVQRSSLTDDQQALMFSAYSKYMYAR